MTYRGNVAIIAGIVKVLSAPSKQKKEIRHE